MALGDDLHVTRIAARLRAQSGDSREALAEVDLFIGRLYERAGRPGEALAAYEKANEVWESPESLRAIATDRVSTALAGLEGGSTGGAREGSR